MIRRVVLLCALVLFGPITFGRGGEKALAPAPAGAGAKVIQPPGVLQLKPGTVLVCADNCPEFWLPPGVFRMYRGASDWDKAVEHLARHPNNSVRDLCLCGHGTNAGGVSTAKGPGLVVDALTDDHVKAIQSKLTADAVIVLIGCHSGCNDKVLELAKRLDRRVVANTGLIYPPCDGKGNWVVFCPVGKENELPSYLPPAPPPPPPAPPREPRISSFQDR